jgi:hypothetical protein
MGNGGCELRAAMRTLEFTQSGPLPLRGRVREGPPFPALRGEGAREF